MVSTITVSVTWKRIGLISPEEKRGYRKNSRKVKIAIPEPVRKAARSTFAEASSRSTVKRVCLATGHGCCPAGSRWVDEHVNPPITSDLGSAFAQSPMPHQEFDAALRRGATST